MTNNSSRKVLIVDDDDAIADALGLLLEIEGYRALTADCDNFFQIVKKQRPDIILLDVWLSGTDGRELCSALKKTSLGKNTPVILISASRGLNKSAQTAGANAFLEKPFDLPLVLETIKKYLGD